MGKSDKDHKITNLLEAESKLNNNIEKLLKQLQESSNEELGLIGKIQSLDDQIMEKENQLNRAIKQRNSSKRKIDLILNSTSWKLLAPARKVADLFKGKKPKRSSDAAKIEEHKPIKMNREKTSNQDRNSNALKRLSNLKIRLHNYGFIDRTLEELTSIVKISKESKLRILAARELARWYAVQNTPEGAKKSLELIPVFSDALSGKERRMTVIMEASCYELLGDVNNARKALIKLIESEPHPDLYLAMANLEESLSDRLRWINKVLVEYDVTPITVKDINGSPYDSLSIEKHVSKQSIVNDNPKVTVVMPAYNAEKTISTAVESILKQTWSNLELIIVDDQSTDNTAKIALEYESRDSRVKFLSTGSNGGPYIARNLATQIATGDFITCNDADDWSHPEKIERQVMHLINNPDLIGNISQQARATNDLKFKRWVGYGTLIHANTSSFMYRRQPVVEKVGYLDSVRFGADNEFINRIKKVFGKNSVVNLPTGPLSFQRQSEGSLVENEYFGIRGHYLGARKEYYEAYTLHHDQAKDLYYSFPMKSRPFPVPEPMLPVREETVNGYREFDIVIVTDFRLSDTISSIIENINLCKLHGLRVGLVQMAIYEINPNREISPRIRRLIDGKQVQMLVYGEKISCKLVLVRDPRVLIDYQRYIPHLKTSKTYILVEKSEHNIADSSLFDCKQNLYKYIDSDSDAVWVSINSDSYAQKDIVSLNGVDFKSIKSSSTLIAEEMGISCNFIDEVRIETPSLLTNIDLEVLEDEVTKYKNGDAELEPIVKNLIMKADEALLRGPYSVIDKTSLPPSSNPNDYWHPHPYWWPNPDTSDGLPYIKRDGERAPGTRMYEPESEKYDRTRLQRVFDDSLVLSLAWKFTGDPKYAQHGARILERFFLDPQTRMNPHLKYSQVIMGKRNNMGSSTGIIEMKDLYYYLDSVRLLHIAGTVTEKMLIEFKEWLNEYLEWLLNSPQGKEECNRNNNHGTYYDLQVASIAVFLGKEEILKKTLTRAIDRIQNQFSNDGSQPLELKRTITAHYCAFNLQGWINLAELAIRQGLDLWSYETPAGVGLAKGVNWFLSNASTEWTYQQISEFDYERLSPIWFSIPIQYRNGDLYDYFAKSKYLVKPNFDPHDGIRPFWNLGLKSRVGNKKAGRIFRKEMDNYVEDELNSKQAERQVSHLKYQMFNLGFIEKAYSDLLELVDNGDIYSRKLAARELAVWHANLKTKKDASKAIYFINIYKEDLDDSDKFRQATILETECLQFLNEMDAAKQGISDAINNELHPDLLLMAANLEDNIEKRLAWINQTLELYNLRPISIESKANKPIYDTLYVKGSKFIEEEGMPKVTIIIPAYNAEDTIGTTLNSVLSQTWSNIEVLVVDDCSTDRTPDIVKEYESIDKRVRLLKTESNGGPYIARNIALNYSSGEFITCNDSDDWSHPEKIERQVRHLLENPNIVANTSQQARATTDLFIYRRGNYGYLIFENMSSLMFRKEIVVNKVGYWDSVRFAADNEFIKRLRKVFGKNAVEYLETGPLSFQRQTKTSLTSNSAFGYHGFFMGARLEYKDSVSYFHNGARKLKIDFPLNKRPFAVPEPMWPTREVSRNQYRKFDIVVLSDFRLDESERIMNMTKISKCMSSGGRVAIAQLSSYEVDFKKKRNERIRQFLDTGKLEVLVYGEYVSCDLLIIKPASLLEDKQIFIPRIRAKEIELYSKDGVKIEKDINDTFLKEFVEVL